MKTVLALCAAVFPAMALGECDPQAWITNSDIVTDRPGLCQVARSLDGPQTVCHWAYGFRSESAIAQATHIADHWKRCGATVFAADDSVNHPDSFDQMEYRLDGYRISVSVKDKTALLQSLLFVAVTDVN